MRKRKSLDKLEAFTAEEDNAPFFLAYTDPKVAIDTFAQNPEHEEVWLIIVTCPEDVLSHLLVGDLEHYGACGKYVTPHILRLDPVAEGIITRHAHFTLEMHRTGNGRTPTERKAHSHDVTASTQTTANQEQ
jgi:hypothetical protein